ncbi:MAG: hypothetical protein ABI705_12790, partial [Aestuariivirga sp.]
DSQETCQLETNFNPLLLFVFLFLMVKDTEVCAIYLGKTLNLLIFSSEIMIVLTGCGYGRFLMAS